MLGHNPARKICSEVKRALLDKNMKLRMPKQPVRAAPSGWVPEVGDLVRYQPDMGSAMDLEAVGVKLHECSCVVRITELVQNGGPYGSYGDPSVKCAPVDVEDVVISDDLKWFAPLSPLEALAFQAD